MNNFTDMTNNMTPLESQAWDWIVRLDADEPLTEREKSNLTEWLSRSAAHVEQLKKLNEFWGNPILIELLAPAKKPKKQVNKQTARAFTPVYAFSFALVLSFLGWLLWSQSPFVGQDMASNIANVSQHYSTAIGEQKTFTLADGTQVILNADSQLQTSYSDSSRNIWLLKGEAHFAVAQDKSKPFNVFAANGRVQAVGTAFSVDVAQSELEVLVTEGRIALAVGDNNNNDLTALFANAGVDASLYNQTMQNVAFMDAGDYLGFTQISDIEQAKLAIKDNMKKLSGSQIEAKQAWKNGELMFTGQSLKEIIQQLKRYSPMQITIAHADIETLKIGGRFKINHLDDFLKNLELNFDLSVQETSPGQLMIAKNQTDD